MAGAADQRASESAQGRASALSPAERINRVRLIRSENIGPVAFRQLMARYGAAGEALAALPELARRGGRGRPITIYPVEAAEQEVAELERLGARLVCHGESAYPEALAALDDAPPLVAMLGRAELLSLKAIAVVGARNASANGRRLARQLAADLGGAGLTVVSGLARGIDAAAHEGALGTGTAAVLAGGIDIVFPPENQGLYAEIKARGVLVSEMPAGTQPQARHFPRRNRLISGLSLGVLVVEAAPRSGSLITARLALEQGREVFAVPGSPLDPRARGCNHLIRQGATLVESAEDVLETLAGPLRTPFRERKHDEYAGALPGLPPEGEVDAARRAVEELLGPTPVVVDELVRQCQLSAAIVGTVLLELELAGRVERHPGGRMALAVSEPLSAR
jgi:DNA processing protein